MTERLCSFVSEMYQRIAGRDRPCSKLPQLIGRAQKFDVEVSPAMALQPLA
jgi:hypothetical protein